MAVATTWFTGGLFLDGWAHLHLGQLETFFTPWHAVMYSGQLATTGVLVFALWLGVRRGAGWRQAMPPGYGLALAGAVLFWLGGVGDLAWHSLFGIEASVDALLSPTHLLLATAGLAMGLAPFRAWWRRPDGAVPRALARQLPPMLSLAYAWSVLCFFTQFAHPFTRVLAVSGGRAPVNPALTQALGVASIILQAGLLAGVVLLAARRRRLATGSLTLMLGVNGLLVNALNGQPGFFAAAVAGGVWADVVYAYLRPSPLAPARFHLFAFLLPLPTYGLYFAVLAPEHISWSVHLWAGSIVVAGLSSWLISWLIVPPSVPEQPLVESAYGDAVPVETVLNKLS